MIIWLTGQPGAGKTTIAAALRKEGLIVRYVDDENMVELMPDLESHSRRHIVDRAQAVAAWLDQFTRWEQAIGVSVIAPYRDQREAFKATANVLEVYLHTDEDRSDEVVADYQPPEKDFLSIDTGTCTPEEAVEMIRAAAWEKVDETRRGAE
jgi:adenylylsulfate kinase-like enzyme